MREVMASMNPPKREDSRLQAGGYTADEIYIAGDEIYSPGRIDDEVYGAR